MAETLADEAMKKASEDISVGAWYVGVVVGIISIRIINGIETTSNIPPALVELAYILLIAVAMWQGIKRIVLGILKYLKSS